MNKILLCFERGDTSMLFSKTLFTIAILLAGFACLQAQPGGESLIPKSFSTQNHSFFEENAGQLTDPHGSPQPEIKYYSRVGNLGIYCSNYGISFIATQKLETAPSSDYIADDDSTPSTAKTAVARIELRFKGANTTAIETRSPLSATNSYYNKEVPVIGVRSFRTLVYPDLYPFIDLILESRSEGIKYSFRVRPGGRVSDIALEWKGTDPSLDKEGKMSYPTFLGSLTEEKPVCWTTDGTKIEGGFIVKNGSVKFDIARYPKEQELIIDPVLRWGTYLGGESYDEIKSVLLHDKKAIFLVGITNSPTMIATGGAYQDTLAYTDEPGWIDIFIMRYNFKWERIWGTYFGGLSNDFVQSAALDDEANIYIGGFTGSTGYMATSGVHQDSNARGGSYNLDGFLARFDSSGSRAWATYYGGTGIDAVNGIALAGSGHVYICGHTKSNNGIASANGYKTLYAGGNSQNHNPGGDGFIAKMDASIGKRIWGTYHGGSHDDMLRGIAIDREENIVSVGEAISMSSIATSGGHQPVRGNNDPQQWVPDAMLVKYDSSGTSLWSTYYGGAAYDAALAVTVDTENNIYMGGNTSSDTGIASSGGFDPTINSVWDPDLFLAKFRPGGQRVWGTYFGGKSYEGISALVMDPEENIFLGGITLSDSMATPGAYQQHINGSYDVLLASFDSTGNRNWASYYGGEASERLNSIAFAAKDSFFIGGSTVSTTNIAVIGAELDYPHNDSVEAFFTLFDTLGFCYGTPKPTISGDTALCLGDVSYFTSKYDPNNVYHWTVTGGKILFGEYSDSMSIRWDSVTTGSVKVVTINHVACSDSSETTVHVYPVPNPGFTIDSLGDGGFRFSASDTMQQDYAWTIDPGITYHGHTVSHTFAKSGSFDVKLTVTSPHGCAETHDTIVKIILSSLPEVTGTGLPGIYPNPFGEKIYLTLPASIKGRITVNITNASGKERMLLYEGNPADKAGLSLDCSFLPQGVYFLTIAADDFYIARSLVKLR